MGPIGPCPAVADPAGGSADGTDVAGDQNTVSGDGDNEDSEVPKSTVEAVAYRLCKELNLDPDLRAEMIGMSLRSVYRHLPQDYPDDRGSRGCGPDGRSALHGSRAGVHEAHRYDDQADKRKKGWVLPRRQPVGGPNGQPVQPTSGVDLPCRA